MSSRLAWATETRSPKQHKPKHPATVQVMSLIKTMQTVHLSVRWVQVLSRSQEGGRKSDPVTNVPGLLASTALWEEKP